jgi:hypothetical protein
MALVQVILFGIPAATSHDTDEYPVFLHFELGNLTAQAVWVIPSYPGYLSAESVSEIRVEKGVLRMIVDCADGFQSGPHETAWIRGGYPPGKVCSFFRKDLNKVSCPRSSFRPGW